MLKDRVYIVTGASKGFGLAICRELLSAGARVGMLARGAEALEQAAAEFDEQRVFTAVCDVADAQAVERTFAAVKEHFGAFNGVVNNAGLARPGGAATLREADLLLQVNTNFVGTVLCCRAAIPLLRGQENPRIINISSASAFHFNEMVHLSVYAATKAAVERYTRDLRFEMQDEGIGVTCLRPGNAWTNFSDGWDGELLKAGIDAWQRMGPTMDSGMEPEHVAQAVAHCLGYPEGVAVDLLEVRPNQLIPKLKL